MSNVCNGAKRSQLKASVFFFVFLFRLFFSNDSCIDASRTVARSVTGARRFETSGGARHRAQCTTQHCTVAHERAQRTSRRRRSGSLYSSLMLIERLIKSKRVACVHYFFLLTGSLRCCVARELRSNSRRRQCRRDDRARRNARAGDAQSRQRHAPRRRARRSIARLTRLLR